MEKYVSATLVRPPAKVPCPTCAAHVADLAELRGRCMRSVMDTEHGEDCDYRSGGACDCGHKLRIVERLRDLPLVPS